MSGGVPRWLERLHCQMVAHPARALTALGLCVAVAGAICARTRIEQDIGAMLPDGPGSPREAARLLGEFGALNTLLVDLEIPGATRDQLVDQGAALADRLRRSGAFEEVYTGPSAREAVTLGKVLFEHRLLLLADPAREIEARLQPERLEASLFRLKAQLASPQAFALKRELLADPLGLNSELVAGLSRMGGRVNAYRGQLLSDDGQHLLLVTTPREPALNTRASERLLRELKGEEVRVASASGGPAVLRAVGGPRFATESAGSIQKDVVLTLVTSVLGLMVLFWARFRGLYLLVLTSGLLGVGMLGGLAAVALVQGSIHAMSLGFGAVLVGVAVDYPLHLLNLASVKDAAPQERMARALRETWRPMWLGFGTTAFAFAALFLSRFPALRELALFAGAGVFCSFMATVLLLPPWVARWPPRRWVGVPPWMPKVRGGSLPPRWAWTVTVVLLALSLLCMRALRFDGDLRNLDAQKPETAAEYREVMARFGLGDSESLVVVRGATPEEALARNDAVARYLSVAGARGEVAEFRSLERFLPSRATQKERASALAALDLSAARARLNHAAEEAGFSPGAFDGFWAGVEQVARGELPPLEARDWEGTSLQALMKRFLRCSPDGCLAVTPLRTLSSARVSPLPPGATLLDAGILAERTVAQLPRQLVLLCGAGLALNLLL
ncbi:MAG TPA: MMPL family transporter, partial [Myxococcaceae bacterium]|nr:MMPL family transporter [Myxococcaceae bacterium]